MTSGTRLWVAAVLFVVAAVCFFADAVIELGSATYSHQSALIPGGLMFLALGLCAGLPWPARA